jgi:hypothetical protein
MAVGRSVKLLLALASIFFSGLVEIYNQDICSVLDMYVFYKWIFRFDEGRGRSLCVGPTFVCHSFSASISALSRRPGHYGHCAPFVNALY